MRRLSPKQWAGVGDSAPRARKIRGRNICRQKTRAWHSVSIGKWARRVGKRGSALCPAGWGLRGSAGKNNLRLRINPSEGPFVCSALPAATSSLGRLAPRPCVPKDTGKDEGGGAPGARAGAQENKKGNQQIPGAEVAGSYCARKSLTTYWVYCVWIPQGVVSWPDRERTGKASFG